MYKGPPRGAFRPIPTKFVGSELAGFAIDIERKWSEFGIGGSAEFRLK